MGGWAATAVDLLLPRSCAACDAPLVPGHPDVLCAACRATLTMPATNPCRRCGIPIRPPLLACPACIARPPAFHVARALGLYLAEAGQLNALARAVRAIKFHGHRACATALGRALARLHPMPPGALVVPVPLHVSRLRERGYNQAIWLARAAARAGGWRLVPQALRRQRATAPQVALDAATRRANLREAFVATRPLPGAIVALVDDVLTTGATADACARALRRAGAARVIVLTVGRTP
jgi:ComF family protein